MKNIFVAAIFLFSQLGFTAEKANLVKANKAKTAQAETKKKFQIEDLTFSELLLTKEEMVHLSDQDKVVYIYSMMALTQILEGSQQMQMDYKDEVVTAQSEKLNQNFAPGKYSNVFQILIANAQANPIVMGIAAIGARALPYLARVAGWVSTAAEVGGTKAAAKVASKVGTMSKDVLKKMSGSAKDAAEKLSKAEANLIKTAKSNPGNSRVAKLEYDKAHSVLAKERQAFLAAGGTEAEFTTAIKGSSLKRFIAGTARATPMLAGGYLASIGLDTMTQEKYGFSIGKFIDEKLMAPIENWLTGTDLSGPAVLTEEQIKALKAGDSSKAVDKACLFGGIQSKWVNQGDAIRCTRPPEASNENCKKEDGKFQCPNYGFNLKSGAINASLCIDTVKTENLTVRCSEILRATIEAKAATLDSDDALNDIRKNFGTMIAGLEANDRMKDDNGKTKSIFQYCMADNVAQEKECGAIREVLAFLKSSDIKPILETRVQLAANKPAAPVEGTPAGNTPADDAAAAGVKQ